MSAASGNLFAMTDPFRMVLALDRPGPDYEVWDEAAGIEWVAPAREDVFAGFHLDDEPRRCFAAKPPPATRCCAGSTPKSPPAPAKLLRGAKAALRRLKPRARSARPC
jgi:hypothetical protein